MLLSVNLPLSHARFTIKNPFQHFYIFVFSVDVSENLFEDSNDLYRFLDHEPVVSSQCYNIPRGIIDVKPKPISEIASRLRLLVSAILEAYTSEDGRHVDYRSIHGSEEYARCYLSEPLVFASIYLYNLHLFLTLLLLATSDI